ncbi:unnamed protein product [Acanthoscelides obtectus]|nr:unnamed protein product [Acanthoscelides obtectus]CAK1626099.1 hypothetical protein AOBTE_LOCUS3608 [Acanthoscelides obtectus]
MKDARDIFNKTQEKCPNLKTDAEDVLKKVGECVVKIEMGSKTICQVIKEKIPKCSKPIIDLITPCVEEQHQYLVRLTFKMVQALMDQACNSTVEELLGWFYIGFSNRDLTTLIFHCEHTVKSTTELSMSKYSVKKTFSLRTNNAYK